jgi:hypothetical protein
VSRSPAPFGPDKLLYKMVTDGALMTVCRRVPLSRHLDGKPISCTDLLNVVLCDICKAQQVYPFELVNLYASDSCSNQHLPFPSVVIQPPVPSEWILSTTSAVSLGPLPFPPPPVDRLPPSTSSIVPLKRSHPPDSVSHGIMFRRGYCGRQGLLSNITTSQPRLLPTPVLGGATVNPQVPTPLDVVMTKPENSSGLSSQLLPSSSISEPSSLSDVSWEPPASNSLPGAYFKLWPNSMDYHATISAFLDSVQCVVCHALHIPADPAHHNHNLGTDYDVFVDGWHKSQLEATQTTRQRISESSYSFCTYCYVEKCQCTPVHPRFSHNDINCPNQHSPAYKREWFLQLVFLALCCGRLRMAIADVVGSPPPCGGVGEWARWASYPWGKGLSRGSVYVALWLADSSK